MSNQNNNMKITEIWTQYLKGQEYNQRLNPDLYSTVNKNERFYAGNQWDGVVNNGLPTPVFNIFKRVINYFIAAIMSQKTTFKFDAEYSNSEPTSLEETEMNEIADVLSAYGDTLSENLKLDSVMREVLQDSAISGDGCQYSYFNTNIDIGQDVVGDIDMEIIDNVNVMFGNPNDRRINYNRRPIQPYIIIVFREMVSKLKQEARANGVSEIEISHIVADEDNEYQSGDRGKIELTNKDDESGKATALLKMWYDSKAKKIKAIKGTKFVNIKKEWDTLLSIYPVAWMNWDTRKNSYHGQALGTGLIPNQLYINKMFAMVMLFMQQMAFPKVVYDNTRIVSYTNQIGAAIPVEGDVEGAIKTTYPAQMSSQLLNTIEYAIKYTKDMIGASDAALGEIKPDNTSAIIAVTQQASIPLENIKMALYQFIEDTGYIWLDIMTNYYGNRKVSVTRKGKKEVVEFDFNRLKDIRMKIKVDVGPSAYWSEITAMQTLDNLLKVDKINFLQYLERIPNGVIPKKQELIDEVKEIMEQQQEMAQQQAQMQQQQAQPPPPQEQQELPDNHEYEQMAAFMEQLPPEAQQILQQMSPDQVEQQVLAMMAMTPEELQQHIIDLMSQ